MPQYYLCFLVFISVLSKYFPLILSFFLSHLTIGSAFTFPCFNFSPCFHLLSFSYVYLFIFLLLSICLSCVFPSFLHPILLPFPHFSHAAILNFFFHPSSMLLFSFSSIPSSCFFLFFLSCLHLTFFLPSLLHVSVLPFFPSSSVVLT